MHFLHQNEVAFSNILLLARLESVRLTGSMVVLKPLVAIGSASWLSQKDWAVSRLLIKLLGFQVLLIQYNWMTCFDPKTLAGIS